jgi:hexosaminidase
MVDAVLPESDSARKLADMVDGALIGQSAKSTEFQSIRKQLVAWHENALALRPILERSFLLKELVPVSETLADLISKALEAMVYIDMGQKPPEKWQEEALESSANAEKPQAEMLIAIVASLKKLIHCAVALADHNRAPV